MSRHRIKIGILLIFALYMNPIIIGGLETICYLLVYGSALVYLLLHSKYIFNRYLCRINLHAAIPLAWVFIALSLSFIVPVLHGTDDYSYINVILGVFRKAIILTFLFLIISKRSEPGAVTETFMYYYSLSSVLYVLSSVILTLSPGLRNIWQNLLRLSNTTLNLLKSYGYTNRFGWAGFSGFRNTIDCTLSLIFLVYLFASEKSKLNIKTPLLALLTSICFLGNMFYGRSGVVASGICLVIGLTLYRKIKPRVLLTIAGNVLVGVFLLNVLRTRIPAINDWYLWISKPFYSFFTTGSFNNYSANRLFNEMIFMPSSKTVLFGDGRYVDASAGTYYMRTDSGFMRQILFWGIRGTLLTYICWLHSLVVIKRDWILKIMLLVMCILFEIKGELYYEMIPLFVIVAMIDYRVLQSDKTTRVIAHK